MVMNPTRLDSDFTPDKGVFFNQESEEADRLVDPEITRVVADFYGDNVTGIEQLKIHLSTISDRHSPYDDQDRQRQSLTAKTDYARAISMFGLAVAYENAKHMLDLRHETDNFTEAGEEISRLFATHIADQLPDTTELDIDGTTYELWGGVLTTAENEQKDKRVTLFGHRDLLAPFAREHYRANEIANNNSAGEKLVRVAGLDDWQKLLDGMSRAAELQSQR